MEQCNVAGQDVYIKDLQDVYYYLRRITNDDFADIVEQIVDGKLSDKDDAIYDLETEIGEAQDEIDSLEEQLGSVEEELDEANRTISELQDELNEQ